MSKTKKLIISYFITTIYVLSAVSPADASLFDLGGITGGVSTGAMNELMTDLGVDKTELKNIIQSGNVARRKMQQPQISLTFEPSNPIPGQKVTAVAIPTYFMNTDKDLYFTWYLKTDGCPEKNHDLSDTQKDKCDLDDDGDIDIYDYKIKAARIIINNDYEWNKSGAYSSHSDEDGYKAIWGGGNQQGKNNYCYVHDVKSGDDYPIECDHHLFAEKSETKHETGDDSFNLEEEKFWHTNPNDPDTADTGNGDEANVAGLGVTSFSWVYSEGDEIGVVTEGISLQPTQKKDSSFMIMFALLNNTCDLDYTNEYPKTTEISRTVTTDTPNPGETSTVIITRKEELIERASTYAKIRTTDTTRTIVTDSTTGATISDNSVNGTSSDSYNNIESNYYPSNIKKVSDLNKCLDKNFIDPAEGGGTKEKMDIELSYSPETPMNDPGSGSKEGDKITVTSSVINANNGDYLNYSWQVYKSDESNPDDWGEPLTKSQLAESTQTSGIGADSLSFRLNFSETSTFYLKVKLTVKENVSKKSVREGSEYVVIPVSSATEKIRTYQTKITSSTSGSPIIGMTDTELCSSGLEKTICPVVKDQIVGVKVPSGALSDFSWTINGQPFSYSTCFYENCNLSKLTNVAYFPILDEPGTQYAVNMTATDISSGKKVNLTRYFQVVEPEVRIVTADENTCKPVLLGNYIDYNGQKWPDWSKTDFEATAGKKIKLSADFTGFIPESANYGWIVDGIGINISNAANYGYEIDEQNNLVIPAKASGETTTVGISALYFPNTLTKKVLNAYWGVSYSGFYETQVSDQIEITSVDSLSNQTAMNNPKGKILASLFSSTPSYIAFLFRIVLTGLLLLFFSGFILSFFPKFKERQI